MLNTSNNNTSFKASFLFNGNKREAKNFVKFITNEVKDSLECNSDILAINKKDHSFVLTGWGCKKPDEISDIINSDEFYNKEKKSFLSGIIDFDPVFGRYEKVHSRKNKGMTEYYKTIHYGRESKPEKNIIPKLDFNERIPLRESFDKIEKIAKLGNHNLNVFKETFKENYGLSDLRVKGVCGVGEESIIFNIDDEKVIKLSLFPCYPIKSEEFDLPIIHSGCIPLRRHDIYYSISPKGQNCYEEKIKRHDVIKVIEMIQNSGYQVNDLLPSHYKQIVIYQGKPYLCDAGLKPYCRFYQLSFLTVQNQHPCRFLVGFLRTKHRVPLMMPFYRHECR